MGTPLKKTHNKMASHRAVLSGLALVGAAFAFALYQKTRELPRVVDSAALNASQQQEQQPQKPQQQQQQPSDDDGSVKAPETNDAPTPAAEESTDDLGALGLSRSTDAPEEFEAHLSTGGSAETATPTEATVLAEETAWAAKQAAADASYLTNQAAVSITTYLTHSLSLSFSLSLHKYLLHL